jgi:hypothetical protein
VRLDCGARIITLLIGEAKMKLIMKWLLGLYAVVGIITMIFQVYYRSPVCSGSMGCGLSFAKGAVWSAIWPAYWAIQWNWLK